jgi:zinc-finger of transposase IS204/IS1001/IS1096/IS1165
VLSPTLPSPLLALTTVTNDPKPLFFRIADATLVPIPFRTAAAGNANGSALLVLALFADDRPCATAIFQRIEAVYDLDTVSTNLSPSRHSPVHALRVLTQLWCDLSNVTLRRVFNTDQGWIMEAHDQNSAVCPGCQSISRSRHSRYWRSLKDLPVQGTQVMLRLHLGRWRCRNAGCQRRIFTERLPKVFAPIRTTD